MVADALDITKAHGTWRHSLGVIVRNSMALMRTSARVISLLGSQ
jgi:hypothetical protein